MFLTIHSDSTFPIGTKNKTKIMALTIFILTILLLIFIISQMVFDKNQKILEKLEKIDDSKINNSNTNIEKVYYKNTLLYKFYDKSNAFLYFKKVDDVDIIYDKNDNNIKSIDIIYDEEKQKYIVYDINNSFSFELEMLDKTLTELFF